MAKYYEIYKVLILATTLSGVYFPSIEKTYGKKWYIKSLKFLFILPGIILPMNSAACLKYQISDKDELENKIYGFTMLVFFWFSTFAFYSFYYYRNDLVRAFEFWDSMFQEELFPEDREELLSKNRKVTNGWLKIFGGVNILCITGYFTIMYANPKKKLGHPTGIPYKFQSPDYELMNTLDFMSCVFGFCTTLTSDSMNMVLLSLEEAQSQHLKRSLARILDPISVTDSGKIVIEADEISDTHSDVLKMKRALEEADKNIRIWVSHHQKILRFHNELQKICGIILSVKYLVFIMLICLVFFLGVKGTLQIGEISLAIVYCCNNYALFYVNVTFADSIAESGASIFGDAFAKDWYLYPKKFKNAFHIILMQSQSPVQYTAFRIYPLSSKGFLTILTSAYSLFTFILQINRKKGQKLQNALPNS